MSGVHGRLWLEDDYDCGKKSNVLGLNYIVIHWNSYYNMPGDLPDRKVHQQRVLSTSGWNPY